DDSATITVRLKDAHGNFLTAGGDSVELATDLGTLSPVVNQGGGTYTAAFSATTPGTATISGKVNGAAMSDTVVINVSVGAADATTSVMETSRTSMTTDDSATITVRLKDAHRTRRSAGVDSVELATDLGTLSPVVDQGDGTYTAAFSATTPGTATISGKVNGTAIADTVVINGSMGAANATTSTMETSQTSMTTDDSATITVRLKDSHGNFLTAGGDSVE